MTYKQYKLEHDGIHKICWLDRTDLKVGCRVRFKKEEEWWTIIEVYDMVKKPENFDLYNQARDYLVRN